MKKKHESKRMSQEEMDSLRKRVDERFAFFLKEGRYKDVLLAMGNLSSYSLHNQLYILLQKEDATTVHGLRKWNELGRRVKKGEKGIKIFRPIRGRKEEEKDNPVYGFRIGYVFDISQTEGEEIRAFSLDENALVENKEKIVSGAKEAVSPLGYRIVYAEKEELGENCFGLCSHKEKLIKIREGLGDLQEVSTLIHECAHALAHGGPREDFEGLTVLGRREIKEVEAESIACIVCAHLGLDTENFNFSYIASWTKGDIGKFRQNLELVSKYARSLIDSIEEAIYEKDE